VQNKKLLVAGYAAIRLYDCMYFRDGIFLRMISLKGSYKITVRVKNKLIISSHTWERICKQLCQKKIKISLLLFLI